MSQTKQLNVLPSMREWWERNQPAPVAKPEKSAKPPKEKKVRTPTTELDLAAIKAIASIRFPVGVGAKKFAAQIQRAAELTDGQRDFLWNIVLRYQRQISDKSLVLHARSQIGGGAR